MKKIRLYITAFVLSALVLGGAFYGVGLYRASHDNGAQLAQAAQEKLFAVISGLEENDAVSYKILSKASEVLGGADIADEKGQFKVPLFSGDAGGSDVIYNLEVTKNGKPLNLNFRLKSGTRALSLSGSGLDKFARISIGEETGGLETRSDWAGSFNVDEMDLEKDLSNLKSFRVALFNNDVMSDIGTSNPLVIEVFETEGGGGPTDDGVNEWEPPSRSDGCKGTQLSICKGKRTNPQIRNVLNNYTTSLMLMGEQLTAVMMQYVGVVGQLLDAKMQMQTQMQLQAMQAQAHKDYHPSEQMCVFGSFVKSVARTEEKARYDRTAFNKIMMDRYLNANFSSGDRGPGLDLESRLRQFREVYCDVQDHNSGLDLLCQHDWDDPKLTPNEETGGQDPERLNKDIDYNRMIDYPYTLNINFTDEISTNDEQDVIALARNLYWPNTLNRGLPDVMARKGPLYLDARRLMAMNNVSHNSFAHIMSMKASAEEGLAEQSGGAFMKAMMRDFDFSDTEIEEFLGEFPSYYAQMEVLTKKLYQHPDFYTNLYDKPANVSRIGASMDAIKLMQMRDWYETVTRREMLSSLLVEAGLTKHVNKIDGATAAAAPQ